MGPTNDKHQDNHGQNSKFLLLILLTAVIVTIPVLIHLYLLPPIISGQAEESTKYYPLTGVQILYNVMEHFCEAIEEIFGFAKTYFHSLRIEEPPEENVEEIKNGPPRFYQAPDLLKTLIKTQLRPKYGGQTSETWIQLFSAITSTLTEEEPIQPAAIIFLSPPNLNSNLSASLALELAEGVNSIFRTIGYKPDGEEQKVLQISKNSWTEMATVSDIHAQLNKYLKESGGKTVIVHSADEINDERQLFVFHGYCDNTHAPDKRATFIFTLTIPESMTEGEGQLQLVEKDGPNIAREILTKAWTSISADKRPALITRVAATVVMIQPEPDD